MDDYINMTKILPEGEKGGYAIRHFALTKAQVDNERLHAAIHGEPMELLGLMPDRMYTKLIAVRNGEIIMSNTPMEMRTNEKFFRYAHGNVLVAGLGLGMILMLAGKKMGVNKIVVIEKEQAIIDLVWKHIWPTMFCKAAIHCGDIFTYAEDIRLKYDRKFDVIYFDIWPVISSDNWEDTKRLKRLWRPLLTRADKVPKPWISSWREDTVRHLSEDDRRRTKLHRTMGQMLRGAI